MTEDTLAGLDDTTIRDMARRYQKIQARTEGAEAKPRDFALIVTTSAAPVHGPVDQAMVFAFDPSTDPFGEPIVSVGPAGGVQRITLDRRGARALAMVLLDFASGSRVHYVGADTTPGGAAFEEWAQQQIGESGGRDPDDYWERLDAREQEAWENVAEAVFDRRDPTRAPKKAPLNEQHEIPPKKST